MSVYSKVTLNHDHGEGTITQYVSANGTLPAGFEVEWEDGCCGEYEENELVAVESDDWAAERDDVLDRFVDELAKATGDGSKKRQAGEKPPWYKDTSHEAAIFSHLTKVKKGELIDPDSGASPWVHIAWRALALACQQTGNVPHG
jgi:hypothetical protein